jgi:hypothetical protein
MTRKIEAPDDEETVWIAEQLVAAGQLVERSGEASLSGSLGDLQGLQSAVNRLGHDPQAKADAFALGLAFGQVFLETNTGFDWWMVDDEYGRDVALRYRDSSLLVFPGTMFTNRLEDGEPIQVAVLFATLARDVDAIRAELGTDD